MSLDFFSNKGSEEPIAEWHQDLLRACFDAISADITLLEAVRDDEGAIIDFRHLTVGKKSSSPTTNNSQEDILLLKKKPSAAEKEFFAKLVNLISKGENNSHVLQYKPDDSDRWFQLQIKLIDDIVVIFREDITAIKEDREKIRQLNQSLILKERESESLNTELRTFTSVAANDYSDTLRNLYTNLEFIIGTDGSKLSDAGKANVRRAQAAVQKLKLLTDDIISYSRIHASDGDLTLVDLVEIVAGVIDRLKIKIDHSQVKVNSGQLPIIQGYPSLLRVLFSHLIDNAIKFRKDNGEHVVHIQARQQEGSTLQHPKAHRDTRYYVITISDNGIGFQQEDAEKIFEMFYRVHEKKYRGSGIGLPICKKIMDIHGGFITAECNPECTVFNCYFPVKWDL